MSAMPTRCEDRCDCHRQCRSLTCRVASGSGGMSSLSRVLIEASIRTASFGASVSQCLEFLSDLEQFDSIVGDFTGFWPIPDSNFLVYWVPGSCCLFTACTLLEFAHASAFRDKMYLVTEILAVRTPASCLPFHTATRQTVLFRASRPCQGLEFLSGLRVV
jgi:hypothetical protein